MEPVYSVQGGVLGIDKWLDAGIIANRINTKVPTRYRRVRSDDLTRSIFRIESSTEPLLPLSAITAHKYILSLKNTISRN